MKLCETNDLGESRRGRDNYVRSGVGCADSICLASFLKLVTYDASGNDRCTNVYFHTVMLKLEKMYNKTT